MSIGDSNKSKSELSFGEARRKVVNNMEACAAGKDALELALEDDIDSLKAAEYALLVPIITKGLENYLEKYEAPKDGDHLNPSQVSDRIGVLLGYDVVDQFHADPHLTVIDHLAKKRAVRLPHFSHMICPVEPVLSSAAYFSAHQLYNVAASNAITIAKNGGMEGRPRQDFVGAVKRSHQLALSTPLVYLGWNRLVTDELQSHGIGLLGDKPSINNDALAYDAAADKAVLTKPLDSWWVEPGDSVEEIVPLQIKDYGSKDARIGCPVSFDPSLVKRYYEHVVDMIEAHQSWPDPIADPEKLRLRKMENLANMGLLHSGVHLL